MKIAYFGADWYIECLDILKKHGHQICHIFICHDRPFNQQLLKYALLNKIPITNTKPTIQDISVLQQQGIDCIFSSEYAWLIPLEGMDFKTINIHPTLLPEGRGPTPLIWLLKKYPQYAGVTFHKLSEQFDQGDIIYQQAIELNPQESWETLVAKLNIQVPTMLDQMLEDFPDLYQSARSQSEGSYWPKIELDDRRIDWNDKVSIIKQLAGCCGRFGVVVEIADQTMLANHLQVSECQHNKPIGTLLREDDETYVMAAADGIVVIMKKSITETLVKNSSKDHSS